MHVYEDGLPMNISTEFVSYLWT